MVGEPVDPFCWLKKPLALPFAAFTIHLGTMASSSPTASTAAAPGGGRSFYSCILPEQLAFWRRALQCVMYAWLDLQSMSYSFGYSSPWSLAGLVLHPAEPSPFTLSSPVGMSASDVAIVIIIHNNRRGSSLPPSGRHGRSLISVIDLPLCCA
jgi:hypothetical protein